MATNQRYYDVGPVFIIFAVSAVLLLIIWVFNSESREQVLLPPGAEKIELCNTNPWVCTPAETKPWVYGGGQKFNMDQKIELVMGLTPLGYHVLVGPTNGTSKKSYPAIYPVSLGEPKIGQTVTEIMFTKYAVGSGSFFNFVSVR